MVSFPLRVGGSLAGGSGSVGALTVGAPAEETQVVPGDRKARVMGDAAGGGLDGRGGRPGNVDGAAAAIAYDVVMRGGVPVVPRTCTVAEGELERLAGLDQPAQRAIDGRRSDAGVLLVHRVDDLGRGGVVGAAAKDVEDGTPLGRQPQPGFVCLHSDN